MVFQDVARGSNSLNASFNSGFSSKRNNYYEVIPMGVTAWAHLMGISCVTGVPDVFH